MAPAENHRLSANRAIRHPNNHFGITHWEIWNEPDIGRMMWSGSMEELFELYAVTAMAIKALDPSLRVGGPAIASPKSEFLSKFILFCQERRLPLDFLSWHTCSASIDKIVDNARNMRRQLDAAGFSLTESHH